MRYWWVLSILLVMTGCGPKKADPVPAAPACKSEQHVEGSTCVANERTCIIPDSYKAGSDGTGIQSWNSANGQWTACQIINCQTGYELVGNACLVNCPSNQHHNPSTAVCENNALSCSISNGVGVQNWNFVFKNYSTCTLQSCNPGFEPYGNTCIATCTSFQHRNMATLMCDPNNVSCPLANGVGQRVWNPAKAIYSDCQPVSCASGYHIEGNVCLANIKPCQTLPAGAVSGTQSWQGDGYGACVITECTWNGHLNTVSNSCDANVISCNEDHGVGTRTWNGSAYNDCVAESCDANYHVENGDCLPDVNYCNPMPDFASVALQSWNSTTQTYGACVVSACVSDYHLENNACLSNTQDCTATMQYAASAVKVWNGSSYGACNAVSCLSGYHLYNNICNTDVIDCVFTSNTNYITNGNFDFNLGSWVGAQAQWASGVAQINQGSNGVEYFRQTINTKFGKTYRLKYDFVATGLPSTQQFAYAVNFGSNPQTGVKLSIPYANTTPATNLIYNFPTFSTATDVVFATEGQTSFTRVDNVEVKEYTVGPALTATQTWNGSTYDACQAQTCLSGHTLQNGQCVYNYIVATGGTISQVGNYRVHVFSATDTFRVVSAPPGATIEYLLVGGGGGGGAIHGGGGGGGGGVLEGTNYPIFAANYPVTVGAGGLGGVWNGADRGQNGASSIFDNLVALGGGGGGGTNTSGHVGGSGGGSSCVSGGFGDTGYGAGTSGQGNRGGSSSCGSNSHGGGGGGAGGSGGDAGGDAGSGGNGMTSIMSGTAEVYGGGGGGSADFSGSSGAGGNGGGGAGVAGRGASGPSVPGNGVDGKGGGGGANGTSGSVTRAGNGGSGVIIIRYLYL